jgi:hypothetical protein
VGLLGLGITFRSIRLATKFTDPTKIPGSFIRKRIPLCGRVSTVSIDGNVQIQHLPILTMPWHKRKEGLLPLTLAGIEPTISGIYTLKLEMDQKKVWFKILSRDNSTLYCVVSEDKLNRWPKSMNRALVERGLARVLPYETQWTRNKDYNALYKSLLEAEEKAQKKRTGIWFEPTQWDVYKQRMAIFVSKIKRFTGR